MTPYNLTFIAKIEDILNLNIPKPVSFKFKSINESYLNQLANLWLEAFPSEIAKNSDAAKAEMKNMFSGKCGKLWSDASVLAFKSSKLVAAICTVYKAPWEATPICPFIIDMMVGKKFRRKGLASYLIKESCKVISQQGNSHIALRVLTENISAINLYRKVGFTDWDGELFAP